VLLYTEIDLSQDTFANLTSIIAEWKDLYISTPFFHNQNNKDEPVRAYIMIDIKQIKNNRNIKTFFSHHPSHCQ
jgi:hypothetical protein